MQISWVSVTVALSDTFLMFSTIPLTVPSSPTYYYYYYYYYECASKSTLLLQDDHISSLVSFLFQGKTYSDKKDFSSCKNCLICPDGYFEQRRCTRKNDTICLKDTEQNKSKNNWKIDNRGRSSGSRQRGGSKTRLKNKNSTQSPTQHSTNTSLKSKCNLCCLSSKTQSLSHVN